MDCFPQLRVLKRNTCFLFLGQHHPSQPTAQLTASFGPSITGARPYCAHLTLWTSQKSCTTPGRPRLAIADLPPFGLLCLSSRMAGSTSLDADKWPFMAF